MQDNAPTPDERLMAALAHLLGPFLAFLIWAFQKDRSRFVRFQALQACAFEALSMAFFLLASGCVAATTLLLPFSLFLGTQQRPAPDDWLTLLPGLAPLVGVAVMLPLFAIWIGVRVWAAASVYRGRNFRYPLLGAMVDRFLDGTFISQNIS